MRPIRPLCTALALAGVGLTAGDAAAQAPRRVFSDSWFWGAKAGAMMYSTTRVENAVAPLVGAEWLITRSRAALNVYAMQAFFDDPSTIVDPSQDAPRNVQMENMRQVGASVFAFPGMFGPLRPYAGAGIGLALISTARAQGTFESAEARDTLLNRLQEARTAAFPVVTLGTQLQLGPLHVFGQAGLMPRRRTFLFNNGNTYLFEGGVRYNFGSAIERPQ